MNTLKRTILAGLLGIIALAGCQSAKAENNSFTECKELAIEFYEENGKPIEDIWEINFVFSNPNECRVFWNEEWINLFEE